MTIFDKRTLLLALVPVAGLLTAAVGPTLAATTPANATTVHVELGENGSMEMIKLDRASVPAGKVIFEVTNTSMVEPHEMIVVKTPLAPTQFPTTPDKSRVIEQKLKGAHEISGLQPGQSGKLTLDLAPGHYVLYCNVKNHFKDGMHTDFEVTG